MAAHLGWQTESDTLEKNEDLPFVYMGQIIVDAGFMTEAEMADALFYFKMNRIVADDTIVLNEGHTGDYLFAQYMEFVKRGFRRIFKLAVELLETETLTALKNEVFVYQPLLGNEDHTLMVGFAANYNDMQAMAGFLHENITNGLDIPAFEESKEETFDLFSEALNNINSPCTYMFNISFDLDLPEVRENAVLTAPLIYSASFMILDYNITVFLVDGASYVFS
jgi:hypothetical protein